MAHVVAVRKNSEGNITDFKLDNGKELNYEECRQAIHTGEVEDLICTTGKSGVISIRSEPDDIKSNNLSNLPEF